MVVETGHRRTKKSTHHTRWTRLEKTVIERMGEVPGGAVREKGFPEETELGHEG